MMYMGRVSMDVHGPRKAAFRKGNNFHDPWFVYRIILKICLFFLHSIQVICITFDKKKCEQIKCRLRCICYQKSLNIWDTAFWNLGDYCYITASHSHLVNRLFCSTPHFGRWVNLINDSIHFQWLYDHWLHSQATHFWSL